LAAKLKRFDSVAKWLWIASRVFLGDSISVPPLYKCRDIFFDFCKQPRARVARAPPGVWGVDKNLQHFGGDNDRVFRRRGFLGDHIEGRAGDAFVAQRIDERGFIDQRAARGIDQERTWFH
jgi:hypothetical protein